MRGIERKGNAEEQRAAVLREEERSRTGKPAIWIRWRDGRGGGGRPTSEERRRDWQDWLRSEPTSTR